MLRIAAVVLITLVVATMVAVAGVAGNGGPNIASAPDLPIGKTFVSGTGTSVYGFGEGEFWRVPLASGDRLVIRYSTTTRTEVYLRLYRPNVTDYTWSDRYGDSVASDATGGNGKHEFAWIATRTARWILLVTGVSRSFGYQMTANVQKFTSVALNAPRLVAVKRVFKVRGTVTGVTGGRLALTLSPGKKRAVVPISKKGTFVWTTRVDKPGRYVVKATYYGDDSHRSSSARAVIQAR